MISAALASRLAPLFMVLAVLFAVGCGGPEPLEAADARSADAEVPADFTREDHLRCVDWPVCPIGVVSPADHALLRVFPQECRAAYDFPITCGACIDARTPACAPFVGKCIAPNSPGFEPQYCASQLAPYGVAQGWTVCTGPDKGEGSTARLVCED